MTALRSSPLLLLAAGLLAAASCSPADGNDSTPAVTGGQATTTVSGANDTATSATLDNGLRVLVTPIADATSVAVVVTFDVGSHHDPPGRSGLAHFAEHLLVTAATAAEPARTVDELVAGYPLGWNAQTGADYTVVATVVDPADLTGELTLLAARVGGVTPTAEDVERERPRMLAEVDNMWGGIPDLAVVNAAKERIAPTPHDGRRGGDPTAIGAITLADLTDWLGYYNPATATLSIAGRVDPGDLMSSVSATFGPVPAGDRPPAPAAAPPPGSPGVTTIETGAAGPGLVAVGYAAPEPSSADYPPFLVAVARLFEAAPTEGLTVSFAPIDDPDALIVSAPLLPGEAAEDAISRTARAVERIVGDALRDDEARRATSAFGPLLGLTPNPFNPYGTAFAAARSAPLRLVPLTDADPAAYGATVDRFFLDAPLAGASAGPP